MQKDVHIQYLKGVGPARAKLFSKLGIESVRDLLHFFPRTYENWKDTVSILEAVPDKQVCIKAIVAQTPEEHRTAGGRLLTKTTATDGTWVMTLTFFNNRYVKNQLEEGAEYLFFGKIQDSIYGGREMLSPRFVKAEGGTGLHPIYHQTQSLNAKAIAKCVRTALNTYPDLLQESLPESLIKQYRLLGLREAVEKIHFPQSEEDILAARRRLIYEELLVLQLGLLQIRSDKNESHAPAMQTDFTKDFYSLLPFTPTNAQKNAVRECVADMQKSNPMNRLLQGDVGAGKTAVAAALVYTAVQNGFQAAVMAPTEVLAEQHAKTFSNFFKDTPIRCALLTGTLTAAQKRNLKNALKAGEIDLLIGTHAILQSDVEFKNLGLVVTDEQHRFGVEQRAALRAKGVAPHTLVMSATPIPRTVALVIYGDLDISILDELPKGRKPILTYAVDTSYRKRLYTFIKKHIADGGQGYIVCPLVEEGETDRVSAQALYEKLAADEFKDYRTGLLHGKIKPKEKEDIMRRFAGGEIQLLICTVVVEVGIDVPNASVMLIENAECFGLSQLHQLRGRIGRGQRQSHCVLVSDAKNEVSQRRFQILCDTNDGFRIADEDLQLRGPGDFFGARQHGLPSLKIADLATDSRILHTAQSDAKRILQQDPTLAKEENQGLQNAVGALFADIS